MKNQTKPKMNQKFILVFLMAVLSVALMGALVSASNTLSINNQIVKVNGLDTNEGPITVASGDTVPVTLDFTALENATHVQVFAWVQGHSSDRVSQDFADLVKGNQYRASFSVPIPSNIDPTQDLTLYLRIESDSGNFEMPVTLNGQRNPYNLDVLLVDMDSSAQAGATVPIGVVLKNNGIHDATDTLVTVKIPELGISKTAYFGDLSPVDQCIVMDTTSNGDCTNNNAGERKLFLTLPSSAKSGAYKVEISAYNADTTTTVVKNLVISQASAQGQIFASPSSKTFAAGDEATYQLVLVNSGTSMAIYNLAPEASDGLSVSLSDSVVVIPAGSSKTVLVTVKADKEGTYGFAVNAVSSDGTSLKTNYTATVQGTASTNNNLVVLTIVLAIVFVVLVVILIVLLTRKPQKTEEFGESYY